jgi:outer membrane protein
MKLLFPLLSATLSLGLSGSALAQQAGNWSASFGMTTLSPSVGSGNLSAPSLPNTQATINSDTQLTGTVNYMVTDHLAISGPLGYGFKYEVSGAGVISGVGKLADTKALPITVLAQYRFMEANAIFRPYVGGGLSYAKFYETHGTAILTALSNPGGPPTTVSFESKLVPTIQLGLLMRLNEKWYLDAHYTKTFLTTLATLSTGQTIEMRLDPNGYSAGIGYSF